MAVESLSSSEAASPRPSQPPARRGLPEGKQPRQRQISRGLLTEAACVCVEGPARTLPRGQAGSATVRPPRLPLGLPQVGSRAHRLADREGCTWEKGAEAVLGSSQLASPLQLRPGWTMGREGRLCPACTSFTSLPRSYAQSSQSLELGSPQGSWDWAACLPAGSFPTVEGRVMGRENHTGQERSWGPIPKGGWHDCIPRPCLPIKTILGCCSSRREGV